MPDTKFGVNRPSTFGGEDVFVKCYRTYVRTYVRTDGRRDNLMKRMEENMRTGEAESEEHRRRWLVGSDELR